MIPFGPREGSSRDPFERNFKPKRRDSGERLGPHNRAL